MLLITMNEFCWTSLNAMLNPALAGLKPEKRIRGFVTRLPLGEALRRINLYEAAFKQHSRTQTLVFDLVSVATIDDLDDAAIELSRAVHVEKLASSLDEMNARLEAM